MGSDPWYIAIVATILTAGGGKYVWEAVKAFRGGPPRASRRLTAVDANIATVARARDELEQDNARLREILMEERKQRAEDEIRHAGERARWLADQERLRADVNRLEERLRLERTESAARYDGLLEQVHQLRLRADVRDQQ